MFTVSGQDALELAQQALQQSSLFALRQLRVNETERGLVISGQVASYYQKQQAQEVVRAAAPDTVVINQIEVV